MNSLQPHEKKTLIQRLQNDLIRKYDGHNFFCELTLRSTYGRFDVLVVKILTISGDENPSPHNMSLISDEIGKYSYMTPSGKNILEKNENSVMIMVDYSKIQ